MACAYSVPSHYMNQGLTIVNQTLTNKLQGNLNQNTNLFIHENASENIVCKMTTILSRPQYVQPDTSLCGQQKAFDFVEYIKSYETSIIPIYFSIESCEIESYRFLSFSDIIAQVTITWGYFLKKMCLFIYFQSCGLYLEGSTKMSTAAISQAHAKMQELFFNCGSRCTDSLMPSSASVIHAIIGLDNALAPDRRQAII